MVIGTPVTTPLSKIVRTPSRVPGSRRTTPSKIREEKILVTIRVRPLSPKEQAAYDLIAWDFPDEQTIVSKNLNHERHTGPYSFDYVFDPTCSTSKVYEQGARDVALSALNGINATIFAYGQTSSGKTFTMRGITESAVNDIYGRIKLTTERDFVLKFSALEIYNETVVDLLNRESVSLRLLDDPEKGVIVEKQVEEIVKDEEHLKTLIGTVEAHRQVGETALNDKSSRSHQIIRLTIESSIRENSGCVKSFLATLNLVDLAGSERASQTSADGTRLKEGSHINRSLLTVTNVIRKLSCSGGKRSGHIPYRDSKLTRILQASLGGNSRTAIICTLSPALSHLEQSRNTLCFATSAKEVTTTAQVNMVVAEKQLLKHLQKEVSRLEAELRSPDPAASPCLRSLLIEKERKIQKMEEEMNELKRQRDLAQSQLELERRSKKELKGSDHHGPSRQVVKCLSFTPEDEEVSGASLSTNLGRKSLLERQAAIRRSTNSTNPSMLVHEIRKLEMRQRQLGDEANHALQLLHKEFASHRIGSQGATETIAKLFSEIKELQKISCIPEQIEIKDKASLKEEIARLRSQESNIASLEQKLENVQRSIDELVMHLPSCHESADSRTAPSKKKRVLPFNLSNTSNIPNIIRSPCSPMSPSSCNIVEGEIENRAPPECNNVGSAGDSFCSQLSTPVKSKDDNCTPGSRQSNSVNMKKMQTMFKKAAEDNIRSIKAYVTELKERVAKLQYQKQLLVCQVLELEANEAASDEADISDQSPLSWHLVFEDQRQQIIMLWHLCHVSLVHRTQFYMLFKGDPSDQIYLEVELRRLTWLDEHLAGLGNASPALLGDDAAGYVSSSIKALKQEREYLAKRVSSKLNAEEREMLYVKWDIPPDGKQRRRLQLVNKLWSDPLNMQNVRDSAEVVAKLVGFCETGEHVSKEMFQLNFVSPSDKKTWIGWNLISNLLHL
ncbi:kinesin-like protein NACK2 [Nicotiana tabacum]|uniref:Kinesin-like protein NACK2 n=1 Tax=Nicotiana tabacum TaxID=4097 RepID=KN7B_TOBAC|nr:kinesin-like protein NACK2 [Nicotiana tabacum]Q8S949.1 RecName: Full=Kinesin-like protein NACK2; AltName: Full=NPK1-activating kinesin 2 [Nicotiana tabacum]BAB86284.1 kinesin-like protein NACK2 [Nicotiana tabacum]